MPQATPTKSFSARWHSLASGAASMSSPYNFFQTVAHPTSTAADELSPAAIGTVEVKTASMPLMFDPFSRKDHATPAGYKAHPVRSVLQPRPDCESISV